MKTKTFIPSACTGDEATFEGSIELRFPSFDEKFDYLEGMNVQVEDDGSVGMGGTSDRLKMMRKMVAMSAKHYVSVSLKNKSSGEEFKSFEDMTADGDCHGILIEVASKLLQGLKVGNA